MFCWFVIEFWFIMKKNFQPVLAVHSNYKFFLQEEKFLLMLYNEKVFFLN